MRHMIDMLKNVLINNGEYDNNEGFSFASTNTCPEYVPEDI